MLKLLLRFLDSIIIAKRDNSFLTFFKLNQDLPNCLYPVCCRMTVKSLCMESPNIFNLCFVLENTAYFCNLMKVI